MARSHWPGADITDAKLRWETTPLDKVRRLT